MNKTGLMSALILGVLFIGGLTVSPKLYAIDKNNRYFAYGVGQRNCDNYIKFREKKLDALEQQYPRYTKDELYEIVDRVIEQWIAGFLTAHDLYVADTYNVAGNTTMDDLMNRLEKICRVNPDQHFAEAMVTLVQQLNPMRIATDPGK